MYLRDALVAESFLRLGPTNQVGKGHKERTSALMYFFACCAAFEKHGCPLDLNPDTTPGLRNRRTVEIEYTRVVTVSPVTFGKAVYVNTLGKVATSTIFPEKAISSNFFTVPLKNASRTSTVFEYPKRPAPILSMGEAATGMPWGLDLHQDWKANLPRFSADAVGSTPFTDLAVFVLRDEANENVGSLIDWASSRIASKFGSKVGSYWEAKLTMEKVLARHTENAFQEQAPGSGRFAIPAAGVARLESLTKNQLLQRVKELEARLRTATEP